MFDIFFITLQEHFVIGKGTKLYYYYLHVVIITNCHNGQLIYSGIINYNILSAIPAS